MVTIFMPMYHVSMIFDPIENIVAVNIITSIYIWMKQTCQKLLTESVKNDDTGIVDDEADEKDSDEALQIAKVGFFFY